MATEFQNKAAMARAQRLVAERKQAEAQLAYAEAEGDLEYAAERIQEIAEMDAKGAQLNELYMRENRQQTYIPPTQENRISRFNGEGFENLPLEEQMRD